MKGTDSSKSTQCDQILAHLSAGKPITPLQALNEYGCMRLGARIYDLRKTGYTINSQKIEVTDRDGKKCFVAEYSMPRQLTPDAQDERDDFNELYAGRGCTCFQVAPCTFCTHEGNPVNQAEDETAWVGGDV